MQKFPMYAFVAYLFKIWYYSIISLIIQLFSSQENSTFFPIYKARFRFQLFSILVRSLLNFRSNPDLLFFLDFLGLCVIRVLCVVSTVFRQFYNFFFPQKLMCNLFIVLGNRRLLCNKRWVALSLCVMCMTKICLLLSVGGQICTEMKSFFVLWF